MFRHAYSNHDDYSKLTGLACEDPSLTVQSDAKDADINEIVRRFGITGQIPVDVRVPLEADFVDVFDFRTAMDAIVAAQQSFAEMPAHVRNRFNNDPASFVDFCLEEKDGKLVNLEEMRKLGLAVDKAPEPVPTPPAT